MQIFLSSLWKKQPARKKVTPWVWGLMGFAILLLSGLFSPTPAGAGAWSKGVAPTPAEASPNLGLTALDVLLKLGLVIGLIYLSLYFLRRWQGKLNGRTTRQLNVIETLSLSPRQTLHLVRAGTQVFLIGATDQTLTQLSPIDLLPEPIETSESVPSALSFSSYLTQSLTPAFAPVKVSHDPES